MDLDSAQTSLLFVVMLSNFVLAITGWKHKRESTEKQVDERLGEIRADCKGLHELWNTHAKEIEVLMVYKAVAANDREAIWRDIHNAYRRIEQLERRRGHSRASDMIDDGS